MSENENEDQEVTEETAAATETGKSGEEEFSFVEDPQFEVDYKGDCAYEVKVVVPVANERKQTDTVFDELARDAELPGFRRGRAPRRLLEKRFAKHVKDDVTAKLVTEAFHKLVKDKDLRPLGTPDVDGLEDAAKREGDAPLAFTLKFEVGPRVELGKYRGLAVERPVLKVEDSVIDEAIENIRKRNAVFETKKTAKAKEGDQVVIDFNGTVDGHEFPGSKAQSYPYILGTKRFFKEFEEVLAGAKAGASLSCEVTFPSDYGNASLRGKQAAFSITVKEVKRKELPEITDEFAQQAGCATVAELREKVADQLRQSAMSQSDEIAKSRLVAQVVKDSTFEFPKSLLKRAVDDEYEERVKELRKARMPEVEIQAKEADTRKEVEERVIASLKPFLALNEIAEAEGIEVTEKDFEQEAAQLGGRLGMSAEAVVNAIDSEGRRDDYETRIFRNKALTVLMNHAAIADKEVSRDELQRQDPEQEKAADES